MKYEHCCRCRLVLFCLTGRIASKNIVSAFDRLKEKFMVEECVYCRKMQLYHGTITGAKFLLIKWTTKIVPDLRHCEAIPYVRVCPECGKERGSHEIL